MTLVNAIIGAVFASNAFTILPHRCRVLGGKMGLNDLTLEKLITEINGYKEKMRAIHEDYGRASQDLQDRINVLGYTLNEHLKETKDQMATTPQRLLNLEAKYVTGEVSDNDYVSQRQEFKGLLEKNLHSIEEIKQMIDVLSHIETKPLSPGEFKQTYPAVNTAAPMPTFSDPWIRATAPERPAPIISPAAQISIPGILSQIAPAPTISIAPVVDTNPPVPQNNGTGLPAPQSSNAVIAAPIEASAPELASTVSESPIATVEAEASPDATINSAPSEDVVEDMADALVVKVVDDVPVMDASATVATVETSQIQPAVSGTETIPSVQPSADVSSTGLTLPSQFYKVVCPKCGADVPKPAKVWELKGGKSKKNVLIGLFQCQDCRVKFREALTREIL